LPNETERVGDTVGTVYRKIVTKALPPGAELFTRKGEQFARWRDARGRTRTAPVTVPDQGEHAGQTRLVIEARTYTAKYRDGSGIIREVATGCHDEQAARAVLGELIRRGELVKSGLMTTAEDAAADHAGTPLTPHIDAYGEHLRAGGVTDIHRKTTLAYLRKLAADCRFGMLTDLDRSALEGWLARESAAGRSARSRNAHRIAAVAFGNWAVDTRRLLANPFDGVPKASEAADPRRKARALTEAELLRLLAVAWQRPLAEYGRESDRKDPKARKGKRAWQLAPLTYATIGAAVERARDRLGDRPDFIAELEATGRERALIYKTLVLTGLRKGELQSVTVGQVQLEQDTPHIQLEAGDEKNREGNAVALRPDLAADLSRWLTDRAESRHGPTVPFLGAITDRLPSDAPLFNVPAGLLRILDRDLRAAGIPKVDERGYRVHIHAMRHTFGTMLARGGVPLRTAQEAMRHSDPKLTANVYTDPKLLDVAGALDVLPALPLDGPLEAEAVALKGTGTDDATARRFAPGFAPATGKSRTWRASADNSGGQGGGRCDEDDSLVSVATVATKEPLTSAVNGCEESGRQDLNLRPLDPQSSALARLRHAPY
jgi:integrase